MKVLIAGGGTGGHVIPGLAIAREVHTRFGAEVEFVGTPRGLENRLVPAAGFKLHLIRVGALKNVGLVTSLKTALDLPRAIFQALGLLRRFGPDVVFGVGGYASGPAMMAATLTGTPMVAFEPNVVPGFANRMISRFVSGAAVQFEETATMFTGGRVTGVPVRKEFFTTQAEAHGRPTLLITGGSQGSRALNTVAVQALPELKNRIPGIQVFHQTGEADLEQVRAAYQQAGVSSEVLAFMQDMPARFAKADLLICRSGASTVAEVAAAGKAAIFVPFPQAADDHQRRNAEAFVSRGAAVMIPQAELTPQRLAYEVAALLNDPERLRVMSSNARTLAREHALDEIVDMVAAAAQAGKE